MSHDLPGNRNKSSLVESSPYGDFERGEMHVFIPEDATRVLDVGCHTGMFGKSLKTKAVREVWGVELNADAARIAAGHLDKVVNSAFSPDVVVPDDYFDVVVFNDVLEHMTDPWEALRIAARKLRANGCVVASIPNIRHIDNLMHIMRERDFKYEPVGIRDRTHLRFFTRLSIRRLFEESGFSITTMAGINEDWWRPSLLRRLAFRLFPGYFDDTRYIQYAVVAQPVPYVQPASDTPLAVQVPVS